MYHYRLLSLLSISILLISFKALAVIDFETPLLSSGWQVINPYTEAGVTFTTPTGSFGDEVVGLVKNNATSACVEPSDENQKLGTGRPEIGLSGFPIWATFSQPLVPPVSVSVQFQSGAGVSARLSLFDSNDTLITEVTDIIPPNGGTCGYPGDARGYITLSLVSDQEVAYAIMDLGAETGNYVFVIDNFEIQQQQQQSETSVSACEPSEPATYSNETREAFIPCLEMPLYTDFDGQPVGVVMGLYSAVLEIPFGFSDFRVKELALLGEIETSNPDNAAFDSESGILYIPSVQVPTITPYLGPAVVSGPILDCYAVLQQSVLRPEVLSLIDYSCDLLSQVPTR